MRVRGVVAWHRVAALALLILAVGASRAGATSHVVQYAYTGSPATFTVPTGVTSLTVFAAGGEGGYGSSVAALGGSGGAPGAGGTVTGTLAVQPGDVVTVDVGSFGASATFSDPSCQASSTTSVPGPGGTTPSGAGRQQAGAGGANAATGEGGSGFSATPRACEAGSGGGGGADTLITLGGTVVAAAAGGGGGGGGGVAGGEDGGAGGNGNGSGGYGGNSIDGAAGGGTVPSSAGHGHVAAMDGGTGGDALTPSGGGGGGGLGYLTSGAGGAGADLGGAGGGGGGGTSYMSGLTNSTVAVNSTPEQGYAAISYVDPPTAAISAPASGGTYTLGQSVTTSFSCAEDPAGPGLSGCVDGNGTSGTPSGFGLLGQITAEAGTGHLDTATPGPHTYTVTASSYDGETGTTSITYTVAGPPSARINSPASGGVYAVGQIVSSTFTCTVGISGAQLTRCQDSQGYGYNVQPPNYLLGSSVNANGVLDTTSVGRHTYSVTATATDGQSAQAHINYTVASAPTAQIQGPASGGTYAYGQSVPTRFRCSPGTYDPGLSSCDDSTGTDTAHGGTGHLDTSSAGQHTYTVTATSQDGQTGTTQITYTVQSPPPPTAKINSPASGSTYTAGQYVATQFTCSEGAGGPGLTSCLDNGGNGVLSGSGQSLQGGGALVTSSPGTFTYSVTATSHDGETGTAQITYTVSVIPPGAKLQDLSVGAGSEPTGVVFDLGSDRVYAALGHANEVVMVASASSCGLMASCSVSVVSGFGSTLQFPESLGLSGLSVFASNFHAASSGAVSSSLGAVRSVPGCKSPAGVAGTGTNVWVSCPGSGELAEFAADGSGTATVGSLPGAGAAPSGVLADPTTAGAVVVADARNNKLYIYTSPTTAPSPAQTVSLEPGCAPAYLAAYQPTPGAGNASDVYVACPGTSDVELVPITAAGAFSGTVTSFNTGGTPVPTRDYGIAANGSTLVVTGSGSNDAYIYTLLSSGAPSGAVHVTSLPAGSAPDGVAIAGSEAYIADEGTGQISIIDPPAAPKLTRPTMQARAALARIAHATLDRAVRSQLQRHQPLIAPLSAPPQPTKKR